MGSMDEKYIPWADMRTALQAVDYVDFKLTKEFNKFNEKLMERDSDWEFDDYFVPRMVDRLDNVCLEVGVLKSCLARLADWMDCPGYIPRKYRRKWTRRS